MLSRHKIPVPPHVIVSRDGPSDTHSTVEEHDDHIIVDGVRLNKPFVEKPVDAEVGSLLGLRLWCLCCVTRG